MLVYFCVSTQNSMQMCDLFGDAFIIKKGKCFFVIFYNKKAALLLVSSPRPIPHTYRKGSGEHLHPVLFSLSPETGESEYLTDWWHKGWWLPPLLHDAITLNVIFERDAQKLVFSATSRCCEQPTVDVNSAFEDVLNELNLILKGEGGGFMTHLR